MHTVHLHFTGENREETVLTDELTDAVHSMQLARDALLSQEDWELLCDTNRRMAVLYNHRH